MNTTAFAPSRPWPADARAPTALSRCLLLAALLHLLLVLVVGSAPPGGALPGPGVSGSLDITLRGPLAGALGGAGAVPGIAREPRLANTAATSGTSAAVVRPESPRPPAASWRQVEPDAESVRHETVAPPDSAVVEAAPPPGARVEPGPPTLAPAQSAPSAAPADEPVPDLARPVPRASTALNPPPIETPTVPLPTLGMPDLPPPDARSEAPRLSAPVPRPINRMVPAPPALEQVRPLPAAELPPMPLVRTAEPPESPRPSAQPIETPAAVVPTARSDEATHRAPPMPRAEEPRPGSVAPAAEPEARRVAPATQGRDGVRPAAGIPDTGDRAGPAIAAPTAAASAPRLNLDLPRPRAGENTSPGSRGLLQLMPRPPETKSKIEREIEKAGRADCRQAYAAMGLLAAVPLAADALRDKGCRW